MLCRWERGGEEERREGNRNIDGTHTHTLQTHTPDKRWGPEDHDDLSDPGCVRDDVIGMGV